MVLFTVWRWLMKNLYRQLLLGFGLASGVGAIQATMGVQEYNSVQEAIDANAVDIQEGVLDLSGRNLRSLEGLDQIPRAEEVTFLNLSGNRFTEIPMGAFDRFEMLETLDLSDNPIEALRGDEFVPLTSMKSVSLYYINVADLPKNLLEHNRALEDFGVSSQSLASLPDGLLEHQQALKTFVAGNSGIASVPEKFFWPAEGTKINRSEF